MRRRRGRRASLLFGSGRVGFERWILRRRVRTRGEGKQKGNELIVVDGGKDELTFRSFSFLSPP